MKKISIIVPLYNSEKFLTKCLESLVNQTYPNYEIILINDGSTDNSKKICEDYMKKHKNIVLINQKNSGQGKARNVGIKAATGDYVTFVDSDDWVDLDMLQILYDNSDFGNCDIVVSGLYKVIGEKEYFYDNFMFLSDDNQSNFIISHPGPVAKLIKKDLLINNNLYFMEKVYYEDLGMIPLLGLFATSYNYIKKGLYYYFIRENSTMQQVKFSPKINDIFLVMDSLEKQFKVNDSNGRFLKELEYLYIEHLLYSATLRYLCYNNVAWDMIIKIRQIIKKKYPKWYKNSLFRKRNIKFKIITYLIYCKCFNIIKILMKIGGR